MKHDYVKILGEKDAIIFIKNSFSADKYLRAWYDIPATSFKEFTYELKNSKNKNRYINDFINAIIDYFLWKWVDHSNSESIKFFELNKQYLDKLKSHIPDIFSLPTNKYKVVYRGTKMNRDKVKKFIKNNSNQSYWRQANIDDIKYMVFIKKSFPYNPHRMYQSFTASPEIATGFNTDYILIAPSNDKNFYFNPKYLNKVRDGGNEDETIHRGSDLKTYFAIELGTYSDLTMGINKPPHISKLKFN